MPYRPCLRAVRGTVFSARLSARARARVSPGIGRALRRRPALRPSPAPASMARGWARHPGTFSRVRLPVEGTPRQQTSFHVHPAYFSTCLLSISPNPSCFLFQVVPYHGNCHAKDRAFMYHAWPSPVPA